MGLAPTFACEGDKVVLVLDTSVAYVVTHIDTDLKRQACEIRETLKQNETTSKRRPRLLKELKAIEVYDG